MSLNGAKADGTCLACTNYNATSMLPFTSSGFEYSSGVGYCSFTCRAGYQYSSVVACVPMTQVVCAATGLTFFSTSVGTAWVDGLDVFISASSGLSLSPVTGLRNAIIAANNVLKTYTSAYGWQANPTVCATTSSGVPQYLGAYLGYAATPCLPCPFSAPPTNGTFKAMTSYTAASCAASPSCSSAYYLNWTRWGCMSCAERARAVCPSSQNFIRGGGCGGVDTPFNTNNARYILG